MIQLYIDGKAAVLKTGTSFKLTRINPYFETQGDYTFDVQLPLLGCRQNQLIFGYAHRPEMALTFLVGKKYSMRLIAPPLNLTGTAEVTNVTEKEIKVQLTAGLSAFTHAIEDDETYIDELDLGNAWDSWPSFKSGDETWQPGVSTDEMARMFHYLPVDTDGKVDVMKIAHGAYGTTDSVCFPIYCASSEKAANPWNYGLPTFNLQLYCTDIELKTYTTDYTLIAPQPYLLDILQRIVKAAGYTVGDWSAYEQDPLVSGIFVANSRSVLRRSAALPHWTLKELITQVQNFLGCVFTVEGKTVNMLKRATWYTGTASRAELASVVDELSTDIDGDGENKGSSSGNVDYDWPDDDDILRLPDEVWENAIIKEFSSYVAILIAYQQLSNTEKTKSLYLYRNKADGKVYAILHRADNTSTFNLQRVDHYGPLLRDTNSRDISTTLKIVPARMTTSAGYWHEDDEVIEFHQGTRADGYPMLLSQDTTLATANYYSVDAAINPDTDSETDDTTTDDAKDILEVAWFDTSTTTTYTTLGTGEKQYRPVPVAVPYIKDDTTGFYALPGNLNIPTGTIGKDGPFSLLETGTAYGNIGTCIGGAATIDTRAQHLFQFTDNIQCDPTVPFLIRGRRYACYKLELTIDEHGIQPLKKGYFCEIN